MNKEQFKNKVEHLLNADGGIYNFILSGCMATIASKEAQSRFLEQAADNFILPKEVLTAVLQELALQFESDNKRFIKSLRPLVKFHYPNQQPAPAPPVPAGFLKGKSLAEIWREYANDFLTLAGMAEYYQQDEETLRNIVEAGKAEHNAIAKAAPYLPGTRLHWHFGKKDYYVFKSAYMESGQVWCDLETPAGEPQSRVKAEELETR